MRIGHPPPQQLTPESQRRLAILGDAMRSLAGQCLQPWIDGARDPLGGAFGFLNRRFEAAVDDNNAPLGPSGEVRGDKSLIQQARHLYSYSLAYQHGLHSEEARGFADSCFLLLKEKFWTGAGLPMRHLLTHSHQPRREESQIYAQSFAIYGLSSYALALNKAAAKRMALDLFETLDRSFHDDRFGGYDQSNDGNWLREVGAPHGAFKCTNTHIHILEALTTLLECYPHHRLLHGRLVEMVQLVGSRLRQPSGYIHRHFALDWTPVGPEECSYGHDLEASWLLLEASNRLDEETQSFAKMSARSIAEHALRAGWDPAGGVFDFGPPAPEGTRPKPEGREKVWWAQAEALPGIYRLLLQTHDKQLVGRLESTFEFLRHMLWDLEYGEFYWSVLSDGSLGSRGDHKGEIWKTPYHALRALLLTSAWIKAAFPSPSV